MGQLETSPAWEVVVLARLTPSIVKLSEQAGTPRIIAATHEFRTRESVPSSLTIHHVTEDEVEWLGKQVFQFSTRTVFIFAHDCHIRTDEWQQLLTSVKDLDPYSGPWRWSKLSDVLVFRGLDINLHTFADFADFLHSCPAQSF
jgi:hypothetical protein